MATAVASVRIDRDLKEQASALAQASGTTIGEIVKKNLQEVVRTKRVPVSDKERARWAAQHKCFEEFMEWRAMLPPCPELATLTDEQMRDMGLVRATSSPLWLAPMYYYGFMHKLKAD